MELALSTLLMGLLGVGVASLMSSGINSQMAYRISEYEQTVVLNIIERLRLDLLAAENITLRNNNQTLSFTTYSFNPAGEAVVWNFSNGVATRNNVPFQLTPSPNIALTVSCGTASINCFVLNYSTVNPSIVDSVTLNELSVAQNITGRGSALDQEFGAARYRINEFSFDVMTGYQFQ